MSWEDTDSCCPQMKYNDNEAIKQLVYISYTCNKRNSALTILWVAHRAVQQLDLPLG